MGIFDWYCTLAVLTSTQMSRFETVLDSCPSLPTKAMESFYGCRQ
jgi:hypothetical protein